MEGQTYRNPKYTNMPTLFLTIAQRHFKGEMIVLLTNASDSGTTGHSQIKKIKEERTSTLGH